MTTQEIAAALASRKTGQKYTVVVRRPGRTRKGVTHQIEKESVIQGILCDYARRAPVRNAVEDGQRDAPELPSHIETSVIIDGVKFWKGKVKEEGAEPKFYLPVPISGNAPQAQWYMDGEPVDAETVRPFVLASEFPNRGTFKEEKEKAEEKGQALFNGITVDNILAVH